MLNHIHINNFTIIDELDLEFAPNMTVLTGETGAGKSIIIDALALALGGRSDSKQVRVGADQCSITLSFDIAQLHEAKAWLVQHELDEKECIIRRVVNKDGRSRNYINGQPSPQSLVKELGTLLVNIHGQHEHQNLLKTDKQRKLLDSYAEILPLAAEVSHVFSTWQDKKNQFDEIEKDLSDKSARLELLSYQVKELDGLAVQKGEYETLVEEHTTLASSEEILGKCQNSLNLMVDEENAILDTIYKVLLNIESLSSIDNHFNSAKECLNNATIHIEEVVSDLRNFIDNFDNNPERLNELEDRLSTIHNLARKHHVKPEFLFEIHAQLNTELSMLDNRDEFIEKLRTEISEIEKTYHQLAKELSDKRIKAAKKLSTLVSKNMQLLGMSGGVFEIACTKTDPTSNGLEKVEFLVAANPGQPLRPLSKVASGGELSRISLAIQVIAAQNNETPTLIFDEVDVGIGGGIAEIVGKLLRELGQNSQVFCVTHLPQVASLGHQHFQIQKTTDKSMTRTQVTLLDSQKRVQEIARMLGGIKITEQTLAHAEEMLQTY